MSASMRNLMPVLALLVFAAAPFGTAAAQVQVNSADPASAVQGTVSLDIVVTGNGFDQTASVKFLVTGTTNPGGVTVRRVVVNGAKKLVATIDVADTAVVDRFDIEVVLSSGRKGKGTTLFTVQSKDAGKPAPVDPCVSPNPVTEATFPAFVYTDTVSLAPQLVAKAAYLGDATGACVKQVSVFPPEDWQRSYDALLRYDPESNLAMIVFGKGAGVEVVTLSITFGENGPSVTDLTGPVMLLDSRPLVPADLAAAAWMWVETSDVSLSPDGTQVVLKNMIAANQSLTAWASSTWVCDVVYDAQSRIQPIDPETCREVHRGILNRQWGESVAWGVVPGTLYITQPSSNDPMQVSLYRLTLQPAPLPATVEELFNDGGTLLTARVTAASEAENGELVALYERVGSPTNCSMVVVIDAYQCANLSCAVVNTKGMRTATWLPDGRLAGKDQTRPDRRGRCQAGVGFVAYPAIDTSNTPATFLIPLTGGNNFEGSGGGW
jgi:hypothetical protein